MDLNTKYTRRSHLHKLTLLLVLRYDAVNFIRLRDVELRPFCHLLKVGTFIQGAAESGLPCCRLSLIALLKFAFKHSPRLWRGKKHNLIKTNIMEKQNLSLL